MKKQIRVNVFETNSSSVHTMTILPEKQFNELSKDGMRYFDVDKKVVTTDEAIEIVNEIRSKWGREPLDVNAMSADELDEALNWYCPTLNSMLLESDYDTYEEHYTTESGETFVVFGYYGMDN